MIAGWFQHLSLAPSIVPPATAGSAGAAVTPEIRQSLAPTGRLRVGVYPGSPSSLLKGPDGDDRGIAVDLGKALAARLGVPYEQVEFSRPAEVLEALKAGSADFNFTNATAERAKVIDFGPAIVGIELGYLVLPGSPVVSMDVDRPGIRIGVTEGGTSHRVLPARLKHAAIVPAASLAQAAELLKSGRIDTYATNKPILYELADQLGNAQILEGNWGVEQLAIGIPKGRGPGLAFVRAFSEEAKAQGLVKRAVERSGMRGAIA